LKCQFAAKRAGAGQFSVTGALYTCLPDLVGFVNPARALFWFNALFLETLIAAIRAHSLKN